MLMSVRRPVFIVLEGVDGSGTTTQAERVTTGMIGAGFPTYTTREPSQGPVGKFLRRILTGVESPLDPQTMALLFTADRMDHLRREIQPALARGENVICDRYYLSSLIYQSETTTVPEAMVNWLRELNRRAMRPDLTIVLHVTAETALERRQARGGKPELFEFQELQARLAPAYANPGYYAPLDMSVVLDGSGTPRKVELAIMRAVVERVPWFEPWKVEP